MNKEDLLKEMKDSIGTKDPIIFFAKMTDAFELLFNRIDDLEHLLEKTKLNSIMAISWDKRVAADMLDKEIKFLRQTDKNLYANEIRLLQGEYMAGKFSDNYNSFCEFWEQTLGYHPFLEARK